MANRNLVRTGTFGGGDGVDDYDRLVNFLRAAHPFLRRKAILYYANEIELICKEAYRQKTKRSPAHPPRSFGRRSRTTPSSRDWNLSPMRHTEQDRP